MTKTVTLIVPTKKEKTHRFPNCKQTTGSNSIIYQKKVTTAALYKDEICYDSCFFDIGVAMAM